MAGPLTSLTEAIDRLEDALIAHADPCVTTEDRAIEMADGINNYAYQLEHENSED